MESVIQLFGPTIGSQILGAFLILWVGTAVVTKTLSPQMIGVENPRPGILIFHLRFSVSFHVMGGAPPEDPLLDGPRQVGQSWSEASASEPPSRAVITMSVNTLSTLDMRFISPILSES